MAQSALTLAANPSLWRWLKDLSSKHVVPSCGPGVHSWSPGATAHPRHIQPIPGADSQSLVLTACPQGPQPIPRVYSPSPGSTAGLQGTQHIPGTYSPSPGPTARLWFCCPSWAFHTCIDCTASQLFVAMLPLDTVLIHPASSSLAVSPVWISSLRHLSDSWGSAL